MKIAVTTETGEFFSFEVDRDCELEQLLALIENETNIPSADQVLFFNGAEVPRTVKVLFDHGVRDNDMILVRVRPRAAAPTMAAPGGAPALGARARAAPRPNLNDPEVLRQQLLADPSAVATLRARNPAIAEAINDPARFAAIVMQQVQAQANQRRELEELRVRAEQDPYDIEVQRRLEDEIRQQNVNNSYEQAMEYAPETFGRVFMLYINCEVNGHKVKAFVDSGAQMTIMSSSFADKCGLSWYLDTRFTGMAKGVGSARILGRVHMSPITIGSLILPCSFTILEEQSVDLLLGLDMLRRHQAVIDLEKNVLRIGTVETPFLGEADLPESARERPEDVAEAEHLANSAAKRARDMQGQSVGGASGAPGSPSASAGTRSTPQAAAAAAAAARASSTPAAPRPSGPPAAAAAPPATAAAAAAPPAAAFPEASVQAVMSLGVSREQAIAALHAANGNADLAAGLLF